MEVLNNTSMEVLNNTSMVQWVRSNLMVNFTFGVIVTV
jgi:hypothetical protein